jgi:hypothetical protein
MESFFYFDGGRSEAFTGGSRSRRWEWLVVVTQTAGAGASGVNNQHLLDNHEPGLR